MYRCILHHCLENLADSHMHNFLPCFGSRNVLDKRYFHIHSHLQKDKYVLLRIFIKDCFSFTLLKFWYMYLSASKIQEKEMSEHQKKGRKPFVKF